MSKKRGSAASCFVFRPTTGSGRRLARTLVDLTQRFQEAERGVVAIETALLGLPFFTLVFGIIVFGITMYTSASLDYATQRAARQIMTGAPQAQNMSAGDFTAQYICPNLPDLLFDCTKITINLKTVVETDSPTNWYRFVKTNQSGIVMPSLGNQNNSFCLGAGNTYQGLEVLYPMPLYFGLMASAPQVINNQFVLMSTLAFKNEPFQGGGGASSSGC